LAPARRQKPSGGLTVTSCEQSRRGPHRMLTLVVRDNQKQVLTKPFCPRRAIVLTKSSGYFTSKIASKGQYVDRKNSWEQAAAKPN
jgi:hypothetical protein